MLDTLQDTMSQLILCLKPLPEVKVEKGFSYETSLNAPLGDM